MKAAITLSVLCFSAHSAFADPEFLPYKYVGLGYAITEYDNSTFDSSAKPTAYFVGFGERYLTWLSIEGRIAKGHKSDDWTETTGARYREAEHSIESFIGLYAKVHAFWKSPVSPYLTIGYTLADLSVRTTEQVPNRRSEDYVDTSEGDTSYGIGAESCSQRWCLSAEYTQYFHTAETTLTSASVTATFKF